MAIVTMPFLFEGKKRRLQAEQGIKELKKHCDTVLVIFNDRLPEIYGNLTMSAAFAKADAVMSIATQAITGIIAAKGDVHVDFEDVKFVLKGGGAAVIGSSVTAGENRAQRAAEEALNSPLLDDTNIQGAQRILLSIMSGPELELDMDELVQITEFIQEKAGEDAETIFGHSIDETLGASIRVTIIASGFPNAKDEFLDASTASVQVDHANSQLLMDNLPATPIHVQDNKKHHLQLVFSAAATGKAKDLSVLPMEDGQDTLYQTAWANNKGWFSAGFGPFRRFTNGDAEYHKLFDGEQHKRLAAHLSLFRENVALVEALNWLKQLKFSSLDSHGSTFLNLLIAFINQPDFLPNGTRLVEVSSKGVFFEDANNARISLDELSDGFRSVLSLAFELLRQLESQYEEEVFETVPVAGQPDLIRVQIPGIVLIDEIDAHLHPIWQKRVGYWLI
ncbi:AAA family ATPase [Hymenobacter arizonensis]|uniref:Tubulin/FtsZ family, GTPase domain n=1 Tax=Hymenobacter arizonensis TaxID=1227077 RepID=A0A1I6BGA7_HYMAR|nr:Tubulin/FtsZ family, GTPase domain [Hymenobacter arizonensis]